MIRYDITLQELERRVESHKPGWLTRAAAKTAQFRTARRFNDPDPIWSEIKPVFMELQHNKCAFCERQFAAASSPGGSAELDLEHFRPKSAVTDWPGRATFPLPTGRANATGYYWLAYHLLNYAVACKVCNTGLKSDHFPIAGRRGRAGQEPDSLDRSEQPYLLYPIGDHDTDPKDAITFVGVNAVPIPPSGRDRHRAEMTIAFFRLNDNGNPEELRLELFRERAEVLDSLGVALGTINDATSSQARKDEAMATVRRMLRPSSRHSSCANAITDLYRDRRTTPQARALIDAARAYLDSLG